MTYWLLANILVVFHIGFVLFVVFGGLLVLWKRKLIYVHVPSALWGVLVEYNGWICPLTPWEQELRVMGGQSGYSGGFVEHYLLPILYPVNLDWNMQIVLGTLVIVVNIVVYIVVGLSMRRARSG